MDNDRRSDPLDRHYVSIKRVETTTTALFYCTAALSLAVLHAQQVPSVSDTEIRTAFVLLVVLYTTFSYFSSLYLVPRAETKRRRQLLSNALGVPLIHDETRNYFNNPLAPSLDRLGASLLENAFFTQKITDRMSVGERYRVLLYFVLWLIALTSRSTELDTVSALTQLVFSGEILHRWLRIEFLRARSEQIYERLHDHFLHKIASSGPKGIAKILDEFGEYESAKARASVKLSSRTFQRNNNKWSVEWGNIASRLEISSH